MEYERSASHVFGRDLPRSRVDSFARAPLPPLRPGTRLQLDKRDRIWAAANHRFEGGSLLDIYEEDGHSGTVVVEGHLVDFTLWGDSLAAIVRGGRAARTHEEARIDWYLVPDRPDER